MRRPRTQESLATGRARCSKLEEGCVLNRLSKATNLCLEAVKERIAVAGFLPNYPDRSSDLSQSMKITTTLNMWVVKMPGASTFTEISTLWWNSEAFSASVSPTPYWQRQTNDQRKEELSQKWCYGWRKATTEARGIRHRKDDMSECIWGM